MFANPFGPARCRAALVAFVLFGLSFDAASAAEALRPVPVRLGGVEALVPALTREGAPFVSLKGIAAALGLAVESEGEGTFLLRGAGGTITFLASAPAMALAPDRAFSLGADALRAEGDLFLPHSGIPPLVAAVQQDEPVLPQAAPEASRRALRREPRRSPPPADRVHRVVIDPGHGGQEQGAVAPNGLVEKELVLDVARRVVARLRAAGFDASLTRDGDRDLSLDDRASIANSRRADLFVSLHANASTYRGARGAETYFLAREATDDQARTTAALENNASGAELPGSAGEEDSSLPLILWDLAQVRYLEESAQLAETIQQSLNAATGVRDRGVRQAPFRVLVGATCPAVLVELGFLSNPQEAELLASSSYRRQLADALVEAIVRFRGDASTVPIAQGER
jgi:N-acetylmuramoyl-L-alanine amidase